MRKLFTTCLFLISVFIFQCEKSIYQQLDMTAVQRSTLNKVLADMEDQYDPAEKMLLSKFSSPGYHTTLKDGMVHRTRQSLTYAVSCLDSQDPGLKQRGLDIVERVIQLQDQDSTSKTYGIWPWFLEEPLEQMSPPDWNWADFCGVQLLQAVLYHRDQFPPDVLDKVNASIYHAARSIERRNVGPGYTNIAIMGTYMTMMTAELQSLPDLKNYAMKRLQDFNDYTMETGAFNEYNSPTYTIVALKELGRMKQHFVDRHALSLANELYRLAWEEIALHFHPPTQQWAGPHSRSYSTLLPQNRLAFIQASTSDKVKFDGVGAYEDPEAHRLSCPCPKELENYFITLSQPRQLNRVFAKGEHPVVGATYLHPGFCLGTVNRGDLWNQRRSLVAYWGSAKNPSYLHLRFLHDGYDFAAAQFFSKQERGNVILGVVLATDGGDRHVNLDRLKEGKFTARDLRLRFEFGGEAAKFPLRIPPTIRDNALLPLPGLDVRLTVPYAAFNGFKPYWQGDKADGKAFYDIVLYEGADREFDLTAIKEAAVAAFVGTGSRNDMPGGVNVEQLKDKVLISYGEMELIFPTRPATRSALHENTK